MLTLDTEANADIYWFVQIDPVNISHQMDVKRKIFSAEFLHIRQTGREKKIVRPAFVTGSQLKFHQCFFMFEQ